MNISAFSIKHRVSTILVFILISIFGFYLYTDLKMTLIPEIKYPAAFVMCHYSGAGPEDMEELVTRPLESAVATISGVDEISSTSQENVSTVTIMYTKNTDVDIAAMKLREKFDQLTLPDGCSDPIIYNMDLNEMMPVMAILLVGEDLSEMQRVADKVVGPTLERIEGVARVQVQGGVGQQVTVATDSGRLAGYQLSISYISQFLAGANILIPGGDVKNGTQTLVVSTDGTLKTVADVANTLISLPTGGTVRLSELADVYLDEYKQDAVAKSEQGSCVVLTVSKQSNANDVETAKEVNKALAGLRAEHPNLNYQVAYDSSEYILSTVNTAIQNIILGMLLASVVVFLFLRRLGATLTIVISMPFCILTVFVIMGLLDVTLNIISLGGIAMGVGMIVDNSIVVLENIYRYAGDGHSRYDACVKGAKEVSLPITASTLTTAAVFVPIALSSGLAGMLFRDFSLTISFLLFSSLIIALTLVPLLCYFLLDEEKVRRRRLMQDEKAPPFADFIAKLRRYYLQALGFLLRRRRYGVLLSVGLIALFLITCINTNMILIPDVDQGSISLSVSLPVGSKLEDTEKTCDRVVEIAIDQVPEIDSLYYAAETETATIVVNLVGLKERNRSSKKIANEMRVALQDIAGCEITVNANSMTAMASGGSPIQLEISGEDPLVINQLAMELKELVAALPDAINVSSSVDTAIPAVKVNVNRENASMYGLTAAGIGTAVRAELNGTTATTMTMNGVDIDVLIKGNDTAASSLDALRSMALTAASGGQVPLSAVADVTVELTPQTITRYNQNRQVNVTGDIVGEDLTGMTAAVNELIAEYELPEGYTVTTGGTYEDMMENFGDLILALIVALGLVYFILASQFESFIMPIIIMMIIPVSFSGALFGLPLTGNDLSIIAFIGIIMLSGLVINSSIILVDYIKVRRQMGASKDDAIIEACPLRIRPILMTTLTTILAMIPLSLGMGDGGELMQPMAVVMISGMLISIIVALFFTPVYYSLIDSMVEKVLGRFRRGKRVGEAMHELAPGEGER